MRITVEFQEPNMIIRLKRIIAKKSKRLKILVVDAILAKE